MVLFTNAPEWTYEVSTAREGAWTVLGHWMNGVESRPASICHATLFGREAPCAHCPLKVGTAVGRTRAGVVALAPDGGFLVALGARTAPTRARVEIHRVGGELLAQLIATRVDDVATRAGLSSREREVLDLVMLGRDIAGIAVALGVSRRTAKYHQANVVAKLGADSRHDVVRLILR